MSKEIVVGLHFYQPYRHAIHPEISATNTDPSGIDWTKRISDECYKPLASQEVVPQINFDLFQSLLQQLREIDPQLEVAYSKNLGEVGIGEPFIHPILPDLSEQDQRLLIRAGRISFYRKTGTHPKYFWPPETAISTTTLEILSEEGYQGFICAPEQIIQKDGSASDNVISQITLPSGRQILAIPFDRPISSRLAFDPKYNADLFTRDYINPRFNHHRSTPIVVWTDAETFGHHWKGADKFLAYLVSSSLRQHGITPININNLDVTHPKMAKIVERSSWSCPHGNLIRWQGSCGCTPGDTEWKAGFYSTFEQLNLQITDVVERELDKLSIDRIPGFFYQATLPDFKPQTPEEALMAAKVSSLIARTSCPTFFEHPITSGKISLLFGYQSLLYLRDTGLTDDADRILTQTFNNLSTVIYPGRLKTALADLLAMLA